MGAVSYLDQEGVVYNSAMKRYNINLNVTQVLNKWLTIGIPVSYTHLCMHPYFASVRKENRRLKNLQRNASN